MSDLTPDFARIAGEQFLKNTSQQANIFLHTVSAYTKAFLDEVNAHEQRMHEAIAKEKEVNSALKALAGSIAHEMRNPLSQIQSSLKLMQMETPPHKHH